MPDILIKGGTVLTQNDQREVIENGAVAISGNEIVDTGSTERVEDTYEADKSIDASDHLVLPGLVNAHVHVSDILLRGGFDPDKGLYDWLYNVKRPGLGVMDPEDHATAAELYTYESITAGVTTFVENVGEIRYNDRGRQATEAKLDVYDTAGIRNIYARGMMDAEPDAALYKLVEEVQARDPDVNHQPPGTFSADTETVLSTVESLIKNFHGSADGRQSVWPAPVVLEANTTECLQGADDLARKHDVLSTIHVAEAAYQESGPLSSVEYLHNIGCLGEHTLLAHCVYIDQRDARILSETGTNVAHNLMSNLRLGGGFAPLRMLRDKGVTACLGTDNSILGDTVNPISDLRVLASAHAGNEKDPGVISPQEALDMVTVEAARAIRRPELGTLEPGTKADVILLEADGNHMIPGPDPVSAIVYSALGSEVDTALCDGEIIMEDKEVTTLPGISLREKAAQTAEVIRERANITRE